MRKTVIGLLGITIGVPAALLGDHFVTGAPSWAWAVIATVVVVGGALIALLSDPIFHRLAPYGRRHGVVSTLVVFAVCGALGAAAWRAMLAWEDSGPSDEPPVIDTRMPVRLEWHREGNDLNVAVINLGTETVRDASLTLIDIRKRSNTGVFVEVPAFHRDGPFTETGLGLKGGVGFDDPPLLPDVRGIAGFLHLNEMGQIFFFRIGDDVLSLIPIPEPGIWRVTFKINGNAKLNNDFAELFFEWAGLGQPATPWFSN